MLVTLRTHAAIAALLRARRQASHRADTDPG
jgi:hypothetical protein